MNCSIDSIKEYLKNNLSEYRYNHSLRVMEEAKRLAIHYNCDVDKCMLCGLTHDIAKEYGNTQNEEVIKKYKISKDMLDDFSSKTIHGLIGSFVVLEKYNFSTDMVNAVRYHTTGYPSMDLLSKIVYLADKIESGKHYPLIEEERRLAYLDIDKAIILCLENQIKHLKEQNKSINRLAIDTLESLKK